MPLWTAGHCMAEIVGTNYLEFHPHLLTRTSMLQLWLIHVTEGYAIHLMVGVSLRTHSCELVTV